MGVYKSYKRRFQLKNCNKIRLEKYRNDKIINEINKCLDEMDENQLEMILSQEELHSKKSNLDLILRQLFLNKFLTNN